MVCCQLRTTYQGSAKTWFNCAFSGASVIEMKNAIGWVAILLSIFSLAPSIVPGAMSLIGLLISIFSLVLSVFSVEKEKRKHFMVTLVIVIFGILVANDTLRLLGAIPRVPMSFKLSAYGVSFLSVVVCIFWTNKLFNRELNT